MAFASPSSSPKRPRLTNGNESSSNQMTPSSSSTSHAPRIKYDVFISFRGADTRRGFLSHLVKALRGKQIQVFVDERLREGDELLHALFAAIEESKIALVIFSENYASSKWCLKELVKINDCRKRNGQIVVPIFYNVDPSHVRHQTGCFQEVFERHENLFREDTEMWRTTMKELANLSGLHYTQAWTEAELIKDVVQRVLTRLKIKNQSVSFKDLVAIDEPIVDLEALMSRIESERVGVIGIWGMGGLGSYFLANVREQIDKYGFTEVQNKLISTLLEDKDLKIDTSSGVPDNVLSRLRRKKVLVVLDDVDDKDDTNQIESLIGGHDWLGQGSRIIVTTRDKHVIEREADCTYELKALESQDALQLLKFHAFTERYPKMSWHDEPMMKVVEYAQGIPLALKVLGSFLCGKTAKQWEDQLQKLQKMPFKKIQNVLRLSYEGLDDDEYQCIFLYIACFFEEREPKADIEVVLVELGFSVSIAFKTLEDRALIRTVPATDDDDEFAFASASASETKGYVSMHDLIREMGSGIVREKGYDKPGEWKHLWDPNDIRRVLNDDEGTDSIKSITLNLVGLKELSLSPQSFARMKNLKLLRIYTLTSLHPLVHLPEGLRELSNKIKLFHWNGFPLPSLPATINLENVVRLKMEASQVTHLWDGVPNLPHLKEIYLTGSMQLVELPDLSTALNLRCIYMDWCERLRSVHSSILALPNIEHVSMHFCLRLEEFSGIEALPPSSVTFPTKLRYIRLGASSLRHLPDIVSKLTSLKRFYLRDCKELETSNLQIIFNGLQSLTHLKLDGCPKLYELPENINRLSSLRKVTLGRTHLESLPESIKYLSKLQYLNLNQCTRLRSIPELPPSIRKLITDDCKSLERVFAPTPELLKQHVTWATQNNYFYGTGISFKNCPKLDEYSFYFFKGYVVFYNMRKEEMRRKMGCPEEIDDYGYDSMDEV